MEEGDQRTRQPEFAKVFLIDRGQLFKMKIYFLKTELAKFYYTCIDS